MEMKCKGKDERNCESKRLKVAQFHAKHRTTPLHFLFMTNFGDVIELKFRLSKKKNRKIRRRSKQTNKQK